MASTKVSVFPAVLKDYDQDYEPQFGGSNTEIKALYQKYVTKSPSSPDRKPPSPIKSAKSTTKSTSSTKPTSPTKCTSPTKSISPTKCFSPPKSTSPTKSISPTKSTSPAKSTSPNKREQSAVSNDSNAPSESEQEYTKADLERFERNYKIWEQAKEISKQQRTADNLNKIHVQRELIKARDALYKQRCDSSREYDIKLREANRALKHATEEALVDACKESLENDRILRALNAESPTHSAKQRRKSKRVKSRSPKRRQKQTPSPNHNASNNLLSIRNFQKRSLTPFKDEADDSLHDEVERDYTDVPWYQEQLYRLYGDHADYFLHPVMIPQEKNVVHPKLAEFGGRSGSDTLWNILRDESNSRLLDVDSMVPKHLKEAYSSFIRQNLSPDKKPLQRNFCVEDDVPYLEELLDKTRITQIRNLRHKVNIMHRLAKTNADKSHILTYNNPMPSEEVISVGDYIASWDDPGSDITATPEPDYYKHLSQKPGERSPIKAIESSSSMQKPRHPLDKLVFLTEETAKSQPMFRQKFADEKEEPILRPFCDFTEKPAMCYENDRSPSPQPDPEILAQFTSPWKPLTMDALIEYSQSMNLKGQGHFRNGQPKMWRMPVLT